MLQLLLLAMNDHPNTLFCLMVPLQSVRGCQNYSLVSVKSMSVGHQVHAVQDHMDTVFAVDDFADTLSEY